MEFTSEKPFIFPAMKKSITELFKNETITKEDIERFQEKYWEQMVPYFSQALKIIDIHDISRHSILWNISDRLLEVVKSRIQAQEAEDSPEKRELWQKLLRTGMIYIHHPYMRSAIMMVLGQMKSIKSKYVSLIVDNEYLYRDAPLPVLRHIWMRNHNKFKEEIMNVLHTYQNAMSEALLDPLLASVTSSNADTLPMLYWPPRRRRKDQSLMKMIEMIGDNAMLYKKALEILREESSKYQQLIEKCATRRTTTSTNETTKKSSELKSGRGSDQKKEDTVSPHRVFISPALLPTSQALAAAFLCTLRFDLLMSFNEAKLEGICKKDPIHHFVWYMDACIKSKRIDRRHASQLVAHLDPIKRRKISHHSLPSGEVGLDQDTSDDWTPEFGERVGRKKSSRAPRTGDKRLFEEMEEDVDESSLKSDQHISVFDRDLQIVCRDPWVVYTICSSLLRLVIASLYEDKTPKTIPEAAFLAHLLVRGFQNDFCAPETVTNRDSEKAEPKCKRSRKNTISLETPSSQSKLDPVAILLTQVLPAAGQLHVSTWRNQVCEEIRSVANRIWPKSGGDSTNHSRPSNAYQRRLNVAQPSPVTVSPSYLAHPVGHLFLQYHAIFALERREWTVLRALLKAAAGAAQGRPLKVSHPNKMSSSVTSSNVAIGFRWRPECLQTICLGIASLPPGSEDLTTAGDGTVASTTASTEGTAEKPSTSGTDTSAAPSTSGVTSPTAAASAAGASGSTSLVTRAELASLLRTSLPLQSDLQLMVLAQCAKLVPATPLTPNTPASAGAATPMPSFFAPNEQQITSRGGSERDRMLNALSRHVEAFPILQQPEGGEEGTIASPTSHNSTSASTGFKSSNPKVVEALDALRRDLERSTPSGLVPIIGSSKSISGIPGTPLSPLSGSGALHQTGMSSPSRLMPPPARFNRRPSGSRYSAFPMATPLTNPGLSMPPPPPPQIPLAEYRPLSPGVVSAGKSSANGTSCYPTYATPMATDMGDGGTLSGYSMSLSPTGDLRRYAAPIESHSPSGPSPEPPRSP